MREEEVSAERPGNPLVLCKLLAVIGRQRMDTVRKGVKQAPASDTA